MSSNASQRIHDSVLLAGDVRKLVLSCRVRIAYTALFLNSAINKVCVSLMVVQLGYQSQKDFSQGLQ